MQFLGPLEKAEKEHGDFLDISLGENRFGLKVNGSSQYSGFRCVSRKKRTTVDPCGKIFPSSKR